MSERLIPFTSEMILAIQEDRKSKTRRIIKPHRADDCFVVVEQADGSLWPYRSDEDGSGMVGDMEVPFECPYGVPGDTLIVREGIRRSNSGCAVYTADGLPVMIDGESMDWRWKVKSLSSRYAPKVTARIRLEIVSVTVKRLQDITEEDAIAEGVESLEAYKILWDKINAKRDYPWESNPWVWQIELRRVR